MGYSKLIKEPTNFEPNKTTYCIDLMFAMQPIIFHSSGVYPTLLTTCHHQVIYAKICFNVYFPPPFQRAIWHYNRASADLIKRSIEQFGCTKSFSNLGLSEQVELFNKALLNIFIYSS